MLDLSASALLLAILIGHGGMHIAIYNRINGFGWPRKVTKSFVKFFLFTTIAIPCVVFWTQFDLLGAWLTSSLSWRSFPPWCQAYAAICLSTWIWLGIPWFVCRPIFRLGWLDAPRRVEIYDVGTLYPQLPLTTKAKFESRLPLNQLFELAVEQVELPVAGLPAEMDGYQIAHLSDLHLTGEIHPDFARFAVEKATEARPDLIALTGDIIDKQACIDWLTDIFSAANAPDGCFFILGNHDTRVNDSWEIRNAMDRAGWIDLGSRAMQRELAGIPCEVIGTEFPWFARPELDKNSSGQFRLLLSHSPDQFAWARAHGVQLMLAGHTHGGQGRLPLVGPILSPSFHGSRYASGDFYKAPTTLHVTRGLGGVHLMRINCRPELSLLTLRSVEY